MQDSSTGPTSVLQFRQDLQAKLRDGVRRAIETVLEEELLAALGADAHERTAGRRGYRHGTIERTVTTREGTRALTLPRGRVQRPGHRQEEFHSTVLPRYARRTREVDDALLGCYFGGLSKWKRRRPVAWHIRGQRAQRDGLSQRLKPGRSLSLVTLQIGPYLETISRKFGMRP